ncbi:site-specific integrase [Sedimentimonas flavescens]|uniref:site-specific integrase n=1 Tax=Sedimentimonas flavescens TaxID=2851012 RepID=UPI001C49CA9C|nr:site-specific integrase [Sedimentimonas flavescens]MBW0157633.1 site-specific integrase [Sedimentimonas flavescens]
MAHGQTYLERRKHGFYWRRRVPARAKISCQTGFLCFPLKTHVPREAAELARRLTAISELCFTAERAVSPEVMQEILVGYARLEIETADRLRALTGPRTRAAAEAALALEAAARASLRDAFFLCDRTLALEPIRDTARRLGITLDESEDDFARLTDDMMRLLIEISEEKERRARGQFRQEQPYLDLALRPAPGLRAPAPAAPPAPMPPPPAQDTAETMAEAKDALDLASPSAPPPPKAETESQILLHSSLGTKVTLDTRKMRQATASGPAPTLTEIFDLWFGDLERGTITSGAYVFEDEAAADKFRKNADTVIGTRKLIVEVFGERPITEIEPADWKGFNDMLRQLPNNHGKSRNERHLSCFEVIAAADRKQDTELRRARRAIKVRGLAGDEAEDLLRRAKVARISPRTFQRHQKHLSAPLDYAVEKGLISHNPFKPFVLGEKMIGEMNSRRPEASRQIWGDEIKALFATDKWTSPKTAIDDPLYWVPLIARLSGMRSEEILQLKPENIRSDNGIWYFDIERGTGQSVKSENGQRTVPLHSQLIELGFLELVARQRRLKRLRIFDKIARSKSKKQTFTANFTKSFTYYRKSRKVYDARRDLHAMRTTFNTNCVANGVPDTARRYLMGHKDNDVGIVNYLPEGFALARLKSYIEMDQLDLSMITKRFAAEPAAPKGPRLVTTNGIALSA